MLPLFADENFNRKIVRGVMELAPEISIFQVQQLGLSGMDDPDLLEWLVEDGGVLLSHDYSTVPFFANERLKKGLPLSGVLMVPQTANTKQMIEEIVLATRCFTNEEWARQVWYLPL